MRLHLVIQRHGLPVTRILWSTSSSSLEGNASYKPSANSSSIASTRAPNALFANSGYTIAQLLEDVNEVVPLETEPRLFEDRSTGQWGLEDYVVEVAGSECLHFMDLGGLLRDGDEVVIRSLQISDLRARRLSGRHQISVDGKHLIDGVPFGRPYLKRSTSSRPAIDIPPRKKRRTVYGIGGGYEEEDTEWAPVDHEVTKKALSQLPDQHGDYNEADDEDFYEDYHEGEDSEDDNEDDEAGYGDDETVIRHPIAERIEENPEGARTLESDASDVEPEAEAGDLTQELQELKEDMHMSGLDLLGVYEEQPSRLRSTKSPTVQGSVVLGQSPSLKSPILRSPGGRQVSKSVRFESGRQPQQQESPASHKVKSPVSAKQQSPARSILSKESTSSDSDSDSSISSDSSSSSSSSDEDENEDISSISSSDSSPESSDSSSESSDSEDEDEERKRAIHDLKVNPPGLGSLRTKKSNQRNKLRRRLSKLKEFGVLPEQADFTALREWEEKNGDWNFDASVLAKPAADEKRDAKEQEQAEFEAKRRKLLRDLAAGGVDVDAFTEEKAPPAQAVEQKQTQDEKDREQVEFNAKRQKLLRDLEAGGVNVDAEEQEQEQPKDDTAMEDIQAEPAKRRSLDVAGSRRLLFGSLGVRTPKSKEEEEATRKKLAGKANNFQSQRPVEAEQPEESEDDKDENWGGKLDIRATECIFDDIELTAPPFPFEQRWDEKAHEIIRQRKGWGKKRKRKERIQVYNGGDEEYGYGEGYEGYDGYDGYDGYEDGYDENWEYENGEMQLEYDDAEQEQEQPNGTEADEVEHEQAAPKTSDDGEGDLPEMPKDISTIPDLTEDDLKKSSIIAYKQLDMSKDTNWQPRVSDYRVAEIHQIFEEDNVLKLRLAKRHRRQPKPDDEEDDEDEGPRMYSGFEMPGFEDDEDDDGFREMSFADFIEPKLLRAGEGVGQSDGDRDNDISSVVEESIENRPDPEPPVPNESIEEERPPVDNDQNIDSQVDGVDGVDNSANEAAEAGSTKEEKNDNNARERSESPTVKSPKFEGFRSPRVEGQSPPESAQREQPVSTGDTAANPDNSNGQQSTQDPKQSSNEQSAGNRPIHLDNGPGISENDLQSISSPASLMSFNGLLTQTFPDEESVMQDSSPVAQRKDNKHEDKDNEDKDKKEGSPEREPHSSDDDFVPNPFYEIDKAHEERQRRESEIAEDRNSPYNDDDDPTFMGFSLSPPLHKTKRESEPNNPKSMTNQEESQISSVPEPQWQGASENKENKTETETDTPTKDHEPPPSSQFSDINFVDLTQSSPPASPGGSDEDFAKSQRLPKGPGWVQKNIPSTQRRTRKSKDNSVSSPSLKGRRRRT